MLQKLYTTAKIIILPCFLIMSLIACGISKKSLVKIEIQKITLNDELLSLENLEKSIAQDEKDILKVYLDLFYHYEKCKIKLEKIRDINERFKEKIKIVFLIFFKI